MRDLAKVFDISTKHEIITLPIDEKDEIIQNLLFAFNSATSDESLKEIIFSTYSITLKK